MRLKTSRALDPTIPDLSGIHIWTIKDALCITRVQKCMVEVDSSYLSTLWPAVTQIYLAWLPGSDWVKQTASNTTVVTEETAFLQNWTMVLSRNLETSV